VRFSAASVLIETKQRVVGRVVFEALKQSKHVAAPQRLIVLPGAFRIGFCQTGRDEIQEVVIGHFGTSRSM
jgi:hypothetical protein